jgi:hypothetical protein
MTRSRQVAWMAISGMAMMVMAAACRAGETHAGKDAKTEMTATAKPLKEVKPVVVKLFGSDCDHDVSSTNETLYLAKKDALGWWFTNNCGLGQPVLLCVYKKEKPYDVFDPFKTCTSYLTGGLAIGKPFPLSGKPELLECEARVKGDYVVVVNTGKEVPSDGCPKTLPSPPPPDPKIQTHRLGVVIL